MWVMPKHFEKVLLTFHKVQHKTLNIFRIIRIVFCETLPSLKLDWSKPRISISNKIYNGDAWLRFTE